ncbi:MAG: DUF1428 domain-containing protein [Gammaproteobacteria bacterium]|nr:DUF1428 domain-containing protein [Gammaproteobacteria bacterium]
MSYIDGFIIAVPTANKEKYIQHAFHINPLFKELGATRTMECWSDDISDGTLTDFRKAVKAKDDESIVFAWFEWPDKATRDRGVARMHELAQTDERFDESRFPVPFDGSRMIFGGFETIVEI